MAGSSDGTVEVRITGTLDSSLPAATAAASSEINKLTAATASATGASVAATTATEALAGAQLEEAAATEVATRAHVSNRAATESLVIAHEALSGRLSRIPGSLMILAQAATGASGGMLLMGAAVVGVLGGLAYLEYESLEAKKRIDDLTEGFALTGRASEMSAEGVRYNLQFLSQLPGSTSKAAEGFLQLVSRHAEWSTSLANDVGQLLPAFIKTYGDEAPQAAGRLLGALSDLTLSGFQKLDRELLNLKPAQYETIENLIRTGDTAKAVALIMAQLSAQTGIYIKSLGDQVYDIEQKMARVRLIMSQGNPNNPLMLQELKDLAAGLDVVRGKEAKQGKEAADNRYKTELDDITDANSRLNERTAILTRIATLQRETADAKGRGDTGTANKGQQDIAAEQAKLAEMDKRTAEAGYRSFEDAENAKGEAFKSGSAQRIAIAQQEVDKAKALFGTESNEYSQALGHLNSERRAASEQGAEEAKKAENKRVEAAKKADEEIVTFDRKVTEEREQIARTQTETASRLAKMGVDEQKDILQEQVDAGAITNAQRLAQLMLLVQKEDQADIDALEDQKRNSDLTLAQERELDGQIAVAKEKLRVDADGIGRQMADDARKNAEASAKAWEDANREVISSERQFIASVFQGRQTLGQMLISLGLNIAQKEIEADVAYWTERALLAVESGKIEQMTEKGGVVMDLLFNQQKTVAVAQGQVAQTAAVATGTAAQTTIKAGGAAASNAVEAASDSKSILNSAYTSAAGAYKSIMQTVPPPLNLVLAPIAAGATFAAVAAYDVVSAEGGQWQVGSAVQRTNLHMNEMVLPSRVAGPAREAFEQMASGKQPGSSGAGGDTFHTTLHNSFAGGWDSLMNDPRTRRKIEKHVQSALRRRAA